MVEIPSDLPLETTEVRGKTFRIHSPAKELEGEAAPGLAVQREGETLFFKGTGGGGVKSKERLVVEDCVFIMDLRQRKFDRWNPRRAALAVEGYQEVVVRNCVFINKGHEDDRKNKIAANLSLNDCARVRIENCYSESYSRPWMGQIFVFGCGPTSIRGVEIAGSRQRARRLVGTGIMAATGAGEGKLSVAGPADRALAIYPPGPLRIEDCYIHDESGAQNSDGIYVQSVRPYLIRNCRIENWTSDSLIDAGFRDSAGRKGIDGKPLANHGGLGMIEQCELARGHVKDSVGLGGGLIFRRNVLRDAWLFPYAFDGGTWFVIDNAFLDMSGVIISGFERQTMGWAPKEGMLARGSKAAFYGNLFRNQLGAVLPALYVSTPVPGTALTDIIAADYNAYALDPPPAAWADDRSAGKKYATLAEWREGTGNDRHSTAGPDAALGKIPPDAVALPGGIAADFGKEKRGLTGPVGVSEALAAKAKVASDEAAREFLERNFNIPLAGLKPAGPTAYTFEVKQPGNYRFKVRMEKGAQGVYGIAINGEPTGPPVDVGKRDWQIPFHFTKLASGENTLTLTLPPGVEAPALDHLEFQQIFALPTP